jgi:Xaa-Pro aminopeptidase
VPGFLDRHRAFRLMQEQRLDAIVLSQPETILYASGAFPGVATNWRRAGAAFLVVPADPDIPLAAIVGDLQARSFAAQSGIADLRSHRIWVEAGAHPDPARPVRSPRPAQFDLRHSLALLRDVLTERGLLHTRVGLDLGFVPAADYPAFNTIAVAWQDCTRLVERLRAIKAPAEIERLRDAAEYAAAGLVHLIAAIAPGMDAAQMTRIWQEAAHAEAARRGRPEP